MNEGRSLPDRDASTATGTEAEGTISTGTARWFVAAATAIAIAVAIHQLFNLRVGGYTMLEGMYLYVLAGIFLAIAFLSFRIRAGASPHVPWYDWALAGASLAVAGLDRVLPAHPGGHATGRRTDAFPDRARILLVSDLRGEGA